MKLLLTLVTSLVLSVNALATPIPVPLLIHKHRAITA